MFSRFCLYLTGLIVAFGRKEQVYIQLSLPEGK
jgi:hypothetical protein